MNDIVSGYQPLVTSEFVWAKIEDFVKTAILDIPDLTPDKARRYTTILNRHVTWCWQTCGYPLERDTICNPAVIAESVERTCSHMTDASKRTMRSNLLAMSDALTSYGSGRVAMPTISRSKASAPYTAREVAALRFWASTLSTDHQRINMTLALALGLGAGLRLNEIGDLRARDVTVDDLGVLLTVGGDHPRQVPVLTEWQNLVGALASSMLRKDQHLYRPKASDRSGKTLLQHILSNCPKPPHRLTTHRMRATWIVGHLAAGIPATTIARAAGLESTDALRLYLPFIPELDEKQYRVRLIHGHNLFGEGDL